MNIFSRSGAIGLYVDQSGFCCGIQWSSDGSLLKVASRTIPLTSSGVEQAQSGLNQLVQELSPREDQLIFISFGHLGSTIDLEMPNLPSNDLQKALEFEIPKLTPLSEGDYTWGYRVVESRGEQGLIVRVSILKSLQFEQVIDLVANIDGGVEMILPIEQAVLGEDDFIIKVGKIAFAKEKSGVRKVKFGDTTSYREALTKFKVDTDSFNDDHLEAYYKAIVLAKYAVEGNLRRDVKSWIQLPESVYTKKKRNLKLINLILFNILLLLWGWAGYEEWQQQNKEDAIYRQEITRLEKKWSEIQVASVNDDVVKKIQTEMRDALRNRPGVANLLAEATNLVRDEFWCEKFRFDGERLVLSLVSSETGQEIGSAFKDSEMFTVDAVRSQARSTGGESITLELLINEATQEDSKEESNK
jgi:hypothetical protein